MTEEELKNEGKKLLETIKSSKQYKTGKKLRHAIFITQAIFLICKFIPYAAAYNWSWWIILSPILIWIAFGLIILMALGYSMTRKMKKK